MKKIKILIFILPLIFFSKKGLSQNEIVYAGTKIYQLDKNENKVHLTSQEINDFKEIKFYIIEFEDQAFMKNTPNSLSPLRLNKTDSFLNSREYFAKEENITWKLEITSYPLNNKMRIEMKIFDNETGEIKNIVIIGKEL